MDISTVILILLVVLPLIVIYKLYVKLINTKNDALAALSSIEVQLRKRYDLIPQVLRLAKKFMAYETKLLTDITKLRTKAMQLSTAHTAQETKELFSKDNQLNSKMQALKVAMEDYPDLKSNETIVQAMKSYQDVEDNISAARRYYNASVSSLNSAVEIFPGSWIAVRLGIKKMPFYEDANPKAIQNTIDPDDYL